MSALCAALLLCSIASLPVRGIAQESRKQSATGTAEARTTDQKQRDQKQKGQQEKGDEVEKISERLRQWVIAPNTKKQPILPKSRFEGSKERNYSLKGTVPRKFLQHEKQVFGINLGWTDDCSPKTEKRVARWFFTRKGSDDKPLRYGEKIAIGNGRKPSFIRNKSRNVGVNLGWSETPVYEWQILGGKIGTAVKTGERVVIYNTNNKLCLIYFDRTKGGDLGWPDSKTWGQTLKSKAWALTKKAVRKAIDKYLTL